MHDPAKGKSNGKRVTRHDVAKAAGVSLTTVTHALNPTPGIRMHPDTRRRVQQIADTLGYRPNFMGRALVEGKTYTVGLLQPSYDSIFKGFYQSIMRGLALAMEPDEYHLLALFRSDDHRYLTVITQGRIDGMLVLQSDFDTGHIECILETGIPTVVINKQFEIQAWANGGCVYSDHRQMMSAVVDEFATLGCRTVLQINDFRACDANAMMMDYFSAAVARHVAHGLVGSTLVPDDADFGRQMRNAFAAGLRWDGIFVDGAGVAEVLLDAAAVSGLLAGRDFHLITTDTTDGNTTRQRLEHSAYTQQPDIIGLEAWQTLQRLLTGADGPRNVLVPYRRHAVLNAGALSSSSLPEVAPDE